MINVERIIDQQLPKLRHRPILRKIASKILSRSLHADKLNAFITDNKAYQGFDFLERMLEWLEVRYTLVQKEIENIPTHGRVVIVANHPLGSIDGLILIHLIGQVRKDVKAVATELLLEMEPLKDFFLPVNNFSFKTASRKVGNIIQALEDEQAIILFPAGAVSRTRHDGIKDKAWRTGFLKMAKRGNAPILPIYVGGSNSKLFYGVSMLFEDLSSLMLVGEMFKKSSVQIPIRIGGLIPYEEIQNLHLSNDETAQLMRKHVYRLNKNKPPIFESAKAIAHPEKRQDICHELSKHPIISRPSPGYCVYSVSYESDSSVLREIGRLREVAFRQAGEGSGLRRDIDEYDHYYQHIVLWSETDLEIVGAYRIGCYQDIVKLEGEREYPLYTQTLVNFSEQLTPYLENSVELGRSFIQPKYWGRRSLDYLWQGLFAYIIQHTKARYVFGPVSISGTLPKLAKDLLVQFYLKHYGSSEILATHKIPYHIEADNLAICQDILKGDDYKEDYISMKSHLDHLGCSIPTLYKKYTALCKPGGAKFLCFGIDPEFGYCIDGLMLTDLTMLMPKMRERYVERLKDTSLTEKEDTIVQEPD